MNTHKRIISFLFSICILMPILAQDTNSFEEFRKKIQAEFTESKKQQKKEARAYRRKCIEEFVKYMKSAWQTYSMNAPIPHPIEEDKAPVVYDEQEDTQDEEKEILVNVVPFLQQPPQPQPKPISPIDENEEAAQEEHLFMFYGTPMQVRCGDLASFKLQTCDEKALSDAYLSLTETKYDNLLYDCLLLRQQYHLCDWAYYKMLETMAQSIYGQGSNEAVLVQGVLFSQSGYKVRFALDKENNNVHLFVAADGYIFDYESINIQGGVYYLFDKNKMTDVQVCNAAYPQEKTMSMHIHELPRFSKNQSENRTIAAASYSTTVQTTVNTNLIDFFNDYPTSYINDDFMTRWAYYANAPMSTEVTDSIYPQLKQYLQNTNQLLAVNILLNWVQTGFQYERDDTVWGRDRAFFSEETLYYPFSDCEDRAILFSHLVRDLLGLDVALVYYPGHLATAVCFTEGDVKGDYLMINEQKFIIADPTYIRAKVGRTMPNMDNSVAKVILCEKH